MAAVIRLKFGVPTLVYEMQADDYVAARPFIEHDRARQTACEESMRLAAAHNAKARATWGTLKQWIEGGHPKSSQASGYKLGAQSCHTGEKTQRRRKKRNTKTRRHEGI